MESFHGENCSIDQEQQVQGKKRS
ncbi:hypothetical protein QQP08_025526 [Theobroma cacao]|nr:hypothetical protein QQP08_025526 [Theobroma cacao]